MTDFIITATAGNVQSFYTGKPGADMMSESKADAYQFANVENAEFRARLLARNFAVILGAEFTVIGANN